MDDEVWPPPPEGREGPPTLKRLPGIDVWQSDQSLTLDFVGYRKSRLRLILVFLALGVFSWTTEVTHMGSFSSFLKYAWAHHPWSYFSYFVFPIVTWLEFQLSMCGGRYSLVRNGALTGASFPRSHWNSIRYIRVITWRWWTERKSVCVGLPENAAANPWWWRSFVCKRNELPLPPVPDERTAFALARLIGEFLSVDVVV